MAVDLPSGILKQTDPRETVSNVAESKANWNLVNAKFAGKLTVPTNSNNVYMRGDGLKMYITTLTSRKVKEFDLTVAFDITTASELQELDLSAVTNDLNGLFFKSDGFKLYIMDMPAKTVRAYDLSTAWDVTTASAEVQTFVVSTGLNAKGLFFREDGRLMFMCDVDAGSLIFQFYLSTEWDVSTAVKSEELSFTDPEEVKFSRKGDLLFIIKGATVERYKLASDWRISTATSDTVFTLAPELTSLTGLHFSIAGSKMFVNNNTTMHQFSIRRGWRENE